MRSLLIVAAVALLAGCSQSDTGSATQAAANAAQPKKKAAYCFFKDKETKGWSASRGKDGNVTVKGKAYRSDSRYQAVFGIPEISGLSATLSPTIIQNTTGFGAAENWWDVSATIPNSAAVDTVTVTCGAGTLATLTVKPKG